MRSGDRRRHTLRSRLPALLPVIAVLAFLAPAPCVWSTLARADPDPPEDRQREHAHREALRREYANRRAALGAHLDEGTLVLLGPPPPGVRATPPEPNFFYLCGLTEPGSALVVTIRRPATTEHARRVCEVAAEIERLAGDLRSLLRREGSREFRAGISALLTEADRAVRLARAAVRDDRGPPAIEARLYLRPYSKRRERWEGPTLFPGPAAAAETGIEDTRPIDRLLPDLRQLPPAAMLFVLDPAGTAPGAISPVLRERPDLELRSAGEVVARLRVVKSETEIELIRLACDLTATGLLRTMRNCRPGMAEYELQATFEYACRSGGAARQAFDSIVASGPNGTVLHYRRNERTLMDKDLVLMDVGAEYGGYAADITRTFPANGRFTDEQARIYDVVLAAQKAALAAVRPGARISEINAAAMVIVKQAGLENGLLHSVSHHVGLHVHDPGPDGPLRPGMVITVEPGLYFPETAIGIRIEDTVVVTGDGCEVLSAAIAKERGEIEAIMSGNRATEGRDR